MMYNSLQNYELNLSERGFEMNRLPVASHLNVDEYRMLMLTYANHNRSMGMEERVKYTLSSIVKVKRNIKENCLDVHYKNGNWWKYTKDSWY